MQAYFPNKCRTWGGGKIYPKQWAFSPFFASRKMPQFMFVLIENELSSFQLISLSESFIMSN